MAGLVLFLLPLMGAIHTMTMHQTLAGNFGMIARWKMHRFLLRHSMNFFANEFAGRVSTKVMQTALAIREVALKVIDVFVYAISFVVSMLFMVAAADWRLVIPLLVWLGIYMGILAYFVPKLGRLAQEQADARSMMTGRIVDSYTNISTIKLFSHAGREERYAREGMNVFLGTVHRQMRKISGFNILIDLNNAVVLFSTATLGLYFWMQGSVTAGSVAIAISLAMRVNGMSQWIMWEVTSLFENIGTVYDGMSMMTKPHDIVDVPKAPELAAPQSRHPLRQRPLPLRQEQGRDRRADARYQAGREGRSGRALGCGQDDADEPASALLRSGRRQDHHRRPGHLEGVAGQPARAWSGW